MLNEKHDILEKAMKVYSKMKHTSKTHKSVVDKHLSDVHEIEASILLDNTHIDIGRVIDMNFGADEKAIIKKEIVTILI